MNEAQPGVGRHVVELDPDEALELLAAAPFGRVVFTHRALPMVRTVNHLVDDGVIVIRTRLGASIAVALADLVSDETVVAYQADDIDANTRLGWSVVTTGIARPITDPVLIARCEQELHPWVDSVMDTFIGIQPELVTGIRLVSTPPSPPR